MSVTVAGVSAEACRRLAAQYEQEAAEAAQLMIRARQERARQLALAGVLEHREAAEAVLAEAVAAADAAQHALDATLGPEQQAARRAVEGRQCMEKSQRAEKAGRRDRLPADQLADLRRAVIAAGDVLGMLDAEAALATAARDLAAREADAALDAVQAAHESLAEAERGMADPLSVSLSHDDQVAVLSADLYLAAMRHGTAVAASMMDSADAVPAGWGLSAEQCRIVRDLADEVLIATGWKGWHELRAEHDDLMAKVSIQPAGYAISRQAAAAIAMSGR